MLFVSLTIAVVMVTVSFIFEIMEAKDRKYGPVRHIDYTISGMLRNMFKDLFSKHKK